MTTHDDLVKARFNFNMSRINGLVRLVHSDIDQLRKRGLFQDSNGVRADILRTIIVFLHATFEDFLRSHTPKPNKSFSFYKKTDIEKAFKRGNTDPKNHSSLYIRL